MSLVALVNHVSAAQHRSSRFALLGGAPTCVHDASPPQNGQFEFQPAEETHTQRPPENGEGSAVEAIGNVSGVHQVAGR